MKKLTKVVCFAAFLAVSGPVLAQQVVREGLQIGALGALRTTLPEVAGKYGLQFDIKNFGDSTAALRAVDQGDLEIANTTSQHLVRALTEGMDVVWVAGWGGGYNLLVARKALNLPAHDAAAFKALVEQRKASAPLSIAVPTGSMEHAALLQYLHTAGIDPDRDVKIVNIPFPDHARALDGGQVDMAMTLAGFGALAIGTGSATEVEHMYGGAYGKQEIGFIVPRKLLKSNPDLVQRIIAAHVDAMKLFMGDMDKQVAYEKKYSPFPPNVVEATERNYLRYDYRTNVADLKSMARDLKSLGWAQQDVSARIDSVLDFGPLSKATGLGTDALSHY